MSDCINIKNAKDCCGCRNCQNICPKRAIEMKENSEGFIYPEVNLDICIKCGMCKKVCPWLKEDNTNLTNKLKEPICHAAKNKDVTMQKGSSSGGIFANIANYVLKQNGIVYGAEMNNDLRVLHCEISKESELSRILGSKYVSSDLNNIFLKVQENLEKGILILFSGVPCQVSALLKFLKKEYENLITVEVICHGVPSQKLFDKYIKYLETTIKGKIKEYYFRNKKASNWGTFKAFIKYEKHGQIFTKKINADFDQYYKNFLDGKGYRESCYVCKYAKTERNADFTLGDFWGIEKIMPDFVDYNGISEVILNTEKSKEIFNKCSKNIEYRIVKYSELIVFNGQLKHPTDRDKSRDNWYDDIDNDDYFNNQKINKNIKSYIKLIFPQKLKFKIKKIINKK